MLAFFVLFDLEVSLVLNICFEGLLYKNFVFYVLFLFCVGVGYVVEVEKGFVG